MTSGRVHPFEDKGTRWTLKKPVLGNRESVNGHVQSDIGEKKQNVGTFISKGIICQNYRSSFTFVCSLVFAFNVAVFVTLFSMECFELNMYQGSLSHALNILEDIEVLFSFISELSETNCLLIDSINETNSSAWIDVINRMYMTRNPLLQVYLQMEEVNIAATEAMLSNLSSNSDQHATISSVPIRANLEGTFQEILQGQILYTGDLLANYRHLTHNVEMVHSQAALKFVLNVLEIIANTQTRLLQTKHPACKENNYTNMWYNSSLLDLETQQTDIDFKDWLDTCDVEIEDNIWTKNITKQLCKECFESLYASIETCIISSGKLTGLRTVLSLLVIYWLILTSILFLTGLQFLKAFQNMLSNVQTFSISVERKSRQIAKSKEKSENLLYQMLPKSIADQLKVGKAVDAETFEAVTVYFSDILGFSDIALSKSPIEIVDLLNAIYG